MLYTTRVPVAALVVAATCLIVPPQTQDMLAAIDEGPAGILFAAIFHGTLAFLSLSAWFWARALLAARFDVADTSAARHALPKRDPRVNRHAFVLVPRLMILLSVLLGAGLLMRSGQRLNVLCLAAWAGPVLLLLHSRLSVLERHHGARWARRAADGVNRGELSSCSDPRRVMRQVPARFERLMRRAPFPGEWLAAGGIALGVGTFIDGAVESFCVWSPTHQGLPALAAVIFPGPCTALLAIALMIAPLSALTFLLDGWRIRFDVAGAMIRLRRPPVIAPLLGWIIVAPTLFSLHTVRLVPDTRPDWPVAQRRDLADFFRVWMRDCGPLTGPARPVIVAISGGASRAAIWGARVLGAIEQAGGPGRPSVFAVSSVSGGSLGAAAYMALIAGLEGGERCHSGSTPARARRVASIGASQLAGDALGPLLAGALMVDAPRALLSPFAALARLSTGSQPRGGDRAEAIERAFEQLWRSASPRTRAGDPPPVDFSNPLLSLFYDVNGIRPAMPAWIANGTDMTTGNRLLTVPFSPAGAWPFQAAEDVLAALAADVPISTAINNTARFAYFEPPGELRPHRPETEAAGSTNVDAHPGATAEIVDGGYFDSEALQAAVELADWLAANGSAIIADHRPVEPIIVQATADGVTTDRIVRCGSTVDHPGAVAGTLRPLQLLAPIVGSLAVPNGHSAILLRDTRDRYCPPRGAAKAFFHFYLPGEDGHDLPLNWLLSDTTAGFIWNAMRDPTSGNGAELQSLAEAFGTH